jgi:hypothetical protein
LLHPNDPQQRVAVARDPAALLRGIELQADVLRLQLDGPLAGGPVELVDAAGVVLHTLPAAGRGWHWLDVRAHRGKHVALRIPAGIDLDPVRAVPQAQLVDYSFPAGG